MPRSDKAPTKRRFRILHENGTYFCGMTGIGPRFGGTRDDAEVFDSEPEALAVIGRHWALGGCVVEVERALPDAGK